MTIRNQRVTFRTTPEMKQRIQKVAEERSLNQAEIARMGTIKELDRLEKR